MKMLNVKAHSKLLFAGPITIASSAIVISLVMPQIARASTSTLTPVSPQQLVSWIQADRPISLTGTVTGATSFPLPMPSVLKSSNPASVLSGSTSETFNVWSNGAGSLRAQQVTSAGETDLYMNPGSVWYWDSNTFTATNEASSGASKIGEAGFSNPGSTAVQIVDKLSAYATLSVSGSAMVAGRPAYTLSLVPNAQDSLIGSVKIAVDGLTHIPVRIQVFPKNSSTPAASFGFDTLTFAPQPDSIFSFTPPPGANVVERGSASGTASGGGGSLKTKVIGTGFDSVWVQALSAKQRSAMGGIVKSLTTISTPLGAGYLYTTPIFQAVVLSNGTVVAGPVDTTRLLQVVGEL